MQYRAKNNSTEIYNRLGSYQTCLKYGDICTTSIMKASHILPSRNQRKTLFILCCLQYKSNSITLLLVPSLFTKFKRIKMYFKPTFYNIHLGLI